MQFAERRTRQKRPDPGMQESLINWGYPVCDAAIRRLYPKLGS
jgi:hypothetical protein